MIEHNKLVRDKVPEIIRNDGKSCSVKVLKPSEMLGALRMKLSEEIDEFLVANDPEELADILEVVFALTEYLGVSRVELEEMRVAKAAKNGAFSRRFKLLEVST